MAASARSVSLVLWALAAGCSGGLATNGNGATGSGSAASSGGADGTAGGTTGGSASDGVGAPCNPFQSSTSCASGLVCATSMGENGACKLPGTGLPCVPAQGCASANSCVAQDGGAFACEADCDGTADCPQFDVCLKGECVFNSCEPTADGNYFEPCDADGVDDGLCLPFGSTETYGGCLQGAPADAGALASCDWTSNAASLLCPLGTYCFFDPETSATACEPLCTQGDAGPGCRAGTVCVANEQIDPFLTHGSPGFGTCAPPCEIPGTTAYCPAGESCRQTNPDACEP